MVKSFELGPYKWKVKQLKRLPDNDLGGADPQKHLIRVAATYKDGNNIEQVADDMTKEHTFYHELTHAILMTLNHKLQYDEQFVDSFSMLWAQFEKTKK
jgi:hypothetical protein